MKLKRFIAILIAIALTAPALSFIVSADTKAERQTYEFPAESLAEMEIDFASPVATSGNLKLYFVRYSGCLKESVFTADKVVADRLTGMLEAKLTHEVDEVRPSGLIIGGFASPANGMTPDMVDKGLEAGALITAVDDVPLDSVSDYVNVMANKKLGDAVKISYAKQSSAAKKTTSEEIKDVKEKNESGEEVVVGATAAEKALFFFDYVTENAWNTELGVTTGLRKKPADMEEADFKKIFEVPDSPLYSKINYSIEIKKGTGETIIDPATGEKPENTKVTVSDYAIETVNDFKELKKQFLADYKYFTGLRKEGNAVTVKVDCYYTVYGTETVTVTTGLQCNSIFVLDSQNPDKPYLWRAGVDETEYDIADPDLIPRWKNLMRSLVVLYADQLRSESATGTKVAYSSASAADCKVDYRISGSKLIMSFDFTKAKISFDVEFGLVDGTLYAKILNDSIKEKGSGDAARKIVDIELLPFLGACNSWKDGYCIVPDGSGMMINFNENVNSIYAKEYAFSVGGTDVLDMDKYRRNETRIESTNLPVFGIVNETDKVAVVGYSANADAEASVVTSPAGYAVNLYRSSLRFRYRYTTEILATNITVGNYGNTIGSINVKKIAGKKYSEKPVSDISHEVRYAFLSGDDANYSGLANAYRAYLVKNGDLKDNITSVNTKIPIVLDFFMSTWESQILFTKIVKMTSFQDAKTITEDLYNAGVDNIVAKFVGYARGGFGKYPTTWPIESAVGGASGARSYAEYAKSIGAKTLLEVEPIKANIDNGGFSTKNDIINYGNSIAVTDFTGKNYFLNYVAVERNMKSLARNVKSINFSGVAANTVGNILFQNYNGSTLIHTRTDTLNGWDRTMADLAENTDLLAVEGASLYTLKYANMITGMPEKSSEYHITYKSVPFVQMVIHGYVGYIDEPINLFYDQTVQRLRLVEYGSIPYYKITKEPTENLKLSDYNKLFSSEYGQWKDDIVSFYTECSEKLSDVWDQPMIYHENNGSSAIVRYENGKTLYINYTDSAMQIEGVTVGAYDFEIR